jgi:hypothetical protein
MGYREKVQWKKTRKNPQNPNKSRTDSMKGTTEMKALKTDNGNTTKLAV